MIKQELFTQIGLDSGALTMLGTVAHQLCEPGLYRGSVQLDDAEVAHFQVTVDASAAETQCDVDLAALHNGSSEEHCSCESPPTRWTLAPGGYLLLHVGRGRGGYAVLLAARSGQDWTPVFDSRRLEDGDIFTATVLRPGRYRVTNDAGDAQGTFAVAYPVRGKVPYRPGEPVHVQVGEALEPADIEVGPAQTQVYVARCSTRLRIELEEPYDKDPDSDKEPDCDRPRFRRHAKGRRPR